jgi:hypothetical protein
MFETFFQSAAAESSIVRALPPDARMLLAEAKRPPSYRGFSDSVVITVPIRSEYDHCVSIGGIHSALMVACAMPLLALTASHAVRGGIDVGVGATLGDGEVYGSALERAYTLEHSIAGHPRIAVGSELLSYLAAIRNEPPTTRTKQIARKLAEDCQAVVFRDTDGQPALDYLGPKMAENALRFAGMFSKAYAFIEAELERWRAQGNLKLAERYSKVKDYFDSRKTLWP